ncbi:MAG: hypothetical protein KDB69_01265, partial [Acidimicrobiia bacterium]|nr:hypothetical protein [Acidimicrobiia bacterium]
VIFLIALIAAVVVAVLWLPRATRSEALAVRQSYYDTSSVVRNQLPEAQHALDVVTDPQSTAEALSSSIPIIAQLDTAAFDMKEAAAAPLPSVLPLMPSGEVDALVPLQQQQELLGEEGSGLANQLGNGYIYRVSVPDLLNPGNLPISADTETINTVSITLASSLAADAAIIAELPADPLFVNTYDQAIASHDRYEVWQNEYLGALTSEDTDRARTLIDELDAMRTGLQETNTDDLANFRSEVDNHIVTYAGSLESHLAALTEID